MLRFTLPRILLSGAMALVCLAIGAGRFLAAPDSPAFPADGPVSCATCHDPKFAFTDGSAFSKGIKAQLGGRSAPTVINRAYSLEQFWDGRAKSLEEQAKGPITNPIEMGMAHEACEECINAVPGYRKRFQEVFGADKATIDN